MASNAYLPDFQDTVVPGHRAASTVVRSIRPARAAHDTVTSISPERLVAVIGLLALIVFLLASIAGIARAQVRKGKDFRFAQQAAPKQSATVYSSQGGAGRADAGSVVALSD